jgi:hypothetical protein
MPHYEVVSGEIDGTNGNTPKKKRLFALNPKNAAWRAPVLGGGRIKKITLAGKDEEAGEYVYQAVTTKHRSFAVFVQELKWYERWNKLFGYR